jgi:hypothetical protein
MSTVDIMTRRPDLLPGTLDLLILRTLQRETRERMSNAIARVMKLA